MSRRPILRLCALALVGILAAGCGPPPIGAELFEQRCAGCHTADGTGTGEWLGAGSEAASVSDSKIAEVIRRGRNVMPGFPRLSKVQVDSLVVYIRELQASG